MKKIRILVLAAAFCGTFPLWGIGGLHAQSVVASGFCGKYVSNLSWVLTSDSVLRIYGSGDMHDYYAMHMDYPLWKELSVYTYVMYVIIGDSVTSIGAEAFSSLDLTSVTIGKSVTKIGAPIMTSDAAFGNCKKLTSITVHAVTPPTLIYNPFYQVPQTASVYVPCGSIPAYQTDWGYFSNFIGMGFTDTTFISDTICPNTVYNDNNFYIPAAVAGCYFRTIPSVYQCDSVICLTLAEYPQTLATNYSNSICEGETYNDNNFTNLTQSGIYYDTLQSVHGCDSIVILTLDVISKDTLLITTSICEGETYQENGFNEYEAGTYTQKLQNIHGCDSIIELTLTVNSIILSQICDSIYIGDSYNFHGKFLTENGVYYDTLQSIDGCDSIVELTLKVTGVGIIEIAGRFPNDAQGIEIYDILGRQYNVGANLCVRPNETLPAGIYFVRIQTNDRVIVKKIVINNK